MRKTLLASVLLATGCAFSANAVAGDYLADRRPDKGKKCEQCHDEDPPVKPAKMSKCLSCHEGTYEALAKSTEDKHPNPHYTHVGDKECAVCHKGHKESVLFCNDCHNFKMQVP